MQTPHKHVNILTTERTFSKRGKFIIIEQLRNINTTPTGTLKFRLREAENFWIKKLKTDTIRLKPRTELIQSYALPVMFTLSQLTSSNIISCCKSHLQFCPLKAATAETYAYIYI